ncbi:RNA polymerase subunit sigma-24 [Bacillus sp. FJAT-18017]|uniref:sigma-70 family RNA polymerase sigma factor n=1 Tax=Bacillus sp. FJAT-18017 TaxID=1705566 RepID=UPI0006AD8FEF|nr:sigma-70 family RNA polymerase sigma factor [Bacillus sp. FJAT-18017]ALC91722.1 RNA polymerase subunit sigma-24 [Bacillus sp. FJAT-18017]
MNLIKEVKKAIKGNSSSFEMLIVTHKLMMYRVARTILSRDEDCADAIQEAIMKAFQNIHNLKEPRYFKTWLIRILLNECHQLHRKRKNLVSIDELAEPSSMENGYEKIEVEQLLDMLPLEEKQLLKLFYIEDLSIHDLSLILDIPENTVKTKLRRAREKMQKTLAKDTEVKQWKNGNSY